MFEYNELYKIQFKINESIYLLRIYNFPHISKKPFITLVCRFGNSLILNKLNLILNFIKDSDFVDKYIIEKAIFEHMS